MYGICGGGAFLMVQNLSLKGCGKRMTSIFTCMKLPLNNFHQSAKFKT